MKIDKLMLHCSELIINRTELTQNLQNNKMTIDIQRDRKLTEHKYVGTNPALLLHHNTIS